MTSFASQHRVPLKEGSEEARRHQPEMALTLHVTAIHTLQTENYEMLVTPNVGFSSWIIWFLLSLLWETGLGEQGLRRESNGA